MKLAAALTKNYSITELNLRGNLIKADGAAAIAKALNTRGTKLNYLDITANLIGPATAQIQPLLASTTICLAIDLLQQKVYIDGIQEV